MAFGWMVLCGAPGVASAQESRSAPDATGEARLSVEHLGALPLDATGDEAASRSWVGSRLRVGVVGPLAPGWTGALEIEGLTGYVLGETTQVGLARGADTYLVARDGRRDLARVLPRRALITYGSPQLQATVGADTFSAGLGVLANDGTGERPFGDSWRGNVVARLGVRAAPWRAREGSVVRGLGGLVAADVIVRDENAELYAGDLAGQLVAGARWQLARGWVGGFAAARVQRDRPDPWDPRQSADPNARTMTFAVPLDAAFSLPLTGPSSPWTVQAEGELAAIRGQTDRPYTVETAAGGARVASLGGVTRLSVRHATSPVSALVEAGYASGDNATRDAVVRTFRFHSDYDVGLILFEHALPLLYGRGVDRVFDPGLAAVPPGGTRALVPQGVEGAAYAFPTVSVRLPAGLGARLGGVWAVATADVQDPYSTGVNGGYNTTFGGASPGRRGLGWEGDASLTLDRPVGAASVRAAVEAAVWAPGAALEGVVTSAVPAVRGRVGVRW